MRRVLLQLHLWIGLTLGLVFVLAGVTGSLLVFYVEIDRWLDPRIEAAAPAADAPRATYASMLRALREAHPHRGGAWRLEMPMDARAPVAARYYKPHETEHLGFAPLLAWIEPSTGQVRSSRFWGETAMTWIYDLHYTLLLDRDGRIVMAIVGILLLITLAIGLALWWPRGGNWRGALRFKRGARRERRVYDLHKLAGVYGLLVLVVLCATGVMLEVPQYANPIVERVSPLFRSPVLQSQPPLSGARIDVDAAVAIAQRRFPTATLRWIETPADARGVYRINLRQPGEPSRRFPRTNVWVDQYSGAILAVRDPRANSAGDTVLDWLHPLHSGEAFGLAGRLLILASGLLPPLLFVTGLIRWQHKRGRWR